MPLRPVSELGLMEVTDLASRQSETPVAKPQTRARKTAAQSPRPGPSAAPRGKRTAQADHGRETKGGRQTGRSKASATGASVPKLSGKSQSGASPSSARSDTTPRGAAKPPKRASSPRSRAASSNGAVSRTTSRAQKKVVSATPRTSAAKASGPSDAAKRNGLLLAKIGIPVMTSAVGIAGGVLLSGRGSQRKRRILGTSPTKVNIDLSRASARLDKASRRVGKLAGEMRSVRERTEQLGRHLG